MQERWAARPGNPSPSVSLVNGCEYCSLVHESVALRSGASRDEINDAKKVIELFTSFNAVVDSLRMPCDILPPAAAK